MTNPTPVIKTCRYHAPCGELLLGSLEERLCLCEWMNNPVRRRRIDRRLCHCWGAVMEEGGSSVMDECMSQLDDYFSLARKEFRLPLLLAGTAFQQSVWQALQTIPYGTTLSYAALAARLGNPAAVRAIANANGANALSILIPCHRIIGADGSLTGYAGGLPAKSYLLELERTENLLLTNF